MVVKTSTKPAQNPQNISHATICKDITMVRKLIHTTSLDYIYKLLKHHFL